MPSNITETMVEKYTKPCEKIHLYMDYLLLLQGTLVIPVELTDWEYPLEVANELNLDENHFKQAFLTYLDLLPLVHAAHHLHPLHNDPVKAQKLLIMYTVKLAIIFADKDMLVKYLIEQDDQNNMENSGFYNELGTIIDENDRRYHVEQMLERVSVYKASFLPTIHSRLPWLQAGSNLITWQQVLQKNMHDLTLRNQVFQLFPKAKDIENYIDKNPSIIAESIRKNIINGLRKKYSRENDQQDLDDKEKWLEKKKKTIDKFAKDTLFDQAMIELKLKTPLSRENHRQIATWSKKNQRHHVVVEGEERFLKKLDEDFNRERTENNDVTKEFFIEQQLKSLEGVIELQVSEKLENFIQKASLSELKQIIALTIYPNAHHNPQAAELFYFYNLPEEDFNTYLQLTPCDNFDKIPPVTIVGDSISKQHAEYKLERLSSFDPRAALLGKMTGCCQTIGDHGDDPTRFGITQPNAGFYIVTNPQGQIIAQCMAWKGDDDAIVFDSVEIHIDYLKDLQLISEFFIRLAHQLCSDHNVPAVLVGDSNEISQQIGLFHAPVAATGYSGYDDSRYQRFVAKQSFPLIEAKKTLLQQEVEQQPITMDPETFGSWIELCEYNNLSEPLALFNQRIAERLSIPDEMINDIQTRMRAWLIFLNQTDVNQEEIQKRASEMLKTFPHFISINSLFSSKGSDTRKQGHTVMHMAAESGLWPLVFELLQNGANPNLKWIASNFIRAKTIIYIAAMQDRPDVVRELLKAGCDPFNTDDSELNLLIEVYLRNRDIFDILLSHLETLIIDNTHATLIYSTAEFMIERGDLGSLSKLYTICARKQDLLNSACKKGYLEAVRFIIQEGKKNQESFVFDEIIANILQNQHNKDSSYNSIPDLLWYLASQGLDFSTLPKPGLNLLFIRLAYQTKIENRGNNFYELLELIINNGVDINFTQGDKTLLSIAIQDKHWDLAELLLRKGADQTTSHENGQTIYTMTKDAPPNVKTLVKAPAVKWLVHSFFKPIEVACNAAIKTIRPPENK